MSLASSPAAARPIDSIGRALVLLAVLVVLFLAVKLGGAFLQMLHAAALNAGAGLALAGAAAVYMAGHGFRILRLALLIGGTRIGLRRVASFHLLTAAAALIAPLKLGELYRIFELSYLVQQPIRAILLVVWERVFDVAVILLLLIIALFVAPAEKLPELIALAMIAAAFVAVVAAVAFLLPGNLGRASFFIIRRYRQSSTVRVLELIDGLRRAVEEAPRMLHGKTAALSALTVLVWICEISAFALLTPTVLSGAAAISRFLTFLSSVTRGETDLCAHFTVCAANSEALPYVVTTHGSLAICGVAAGLYYARRRFQSFDQASSGATTPRRLRMR